MLHQQPRQGTDPALPNGRFSCLFSSGNAKIAAALGRCQTQGCTVCFSIIQGIAYNNLKGLRGCVLQYRQAARVRVEIPSLRISPENSTIYEDVWIVHHLAGMEGALRTGELKANWLILTCQFAISVGCHS